MGTITDYARPMPKPRYTPPNDEVAARIDRVVELFQRRQAIEQEYRAALADVGPDGDDVPVAHLAGRLGVQRKTVYRHLGRAMK